MRFNETESPASLQEAERLAYIAGDTDRAAVLGKLADDADELNRLRAMYWTLCDCFPIQSSEKKADILEKVKAIWETLQDAGEVLDAD